MKTNKDNAKANLESAIKALKKGDKRAALNLAKTAVDDIKKSIQDWD